jgi:hypothetical protein
MAGLQPPTRRLTSVPFDRGSRFACVGLRVQIAFQLETMPTEPLPEWLHIGDDGKTVLHPVRNPTLRHIHFLNRSRGMGKRLIVEALDADIANHPAWRGTHWSPSTVQRLLEDRRVFGERRRTPARDAEVQPRHYPPALAGPSGQDGSFTDADYEESERLFYLGEAARERRAGKGPISKNGTCPNYATGLAECVCGGRLTLRNKTKGSIYLECRNRLDKVPLDASGRICNSARHYTLCNLNEALERVLPLFDLSRLTEAADDHAAEAFKALVAEKDAAELAGPKRRQIERAITSEVARIVHRITPDGSDLLIWLRGNSFYQLAFRIFVHGPRPVLRGVVVRTFGADTSDTELRSRDCALDDPDAIGTFERFIATGLTAHLNQQVLKLAARQLDAIPAAELARLRAACLE